MIWQIFFVLGNVAVNTIKVSLSSIPLQKRRRYPLCQRLAIFVLLLYNRLTGNQCFDFILTFSSLCTWRAPLMGRPYGRGRSEPEPQTHVKPLLHAHIRIEVSFGVEVELGILAENEAS